MEKLGFQENIITIKKNGGWFRFYEDEICKIELFYKFSEDSIDGAVKWLSKSGEVDRTLYYKNGKFLFDRRDCI